MLGCAYLGQFHEIPLAPNPKKPIAQLVQPQTFEHPMF